MTSASAHDGKLCHVAVCCRLYGAYCSGYRARLDGVVGVDEHDVFSARGVESGVACGAQSAVCAVYDAHSSVVASPSVAHLWRVVWRAVVDEYDLCDDGSACAVGALCGVVGVCQHAPDALVEGGFCLVDGYDDGYHGVMFTVGVRCKYI